MQHTKGITQAKSRRDLTAINMTMTISTLRQFIPHNVSFRSSKNGFIESPFKRNKQLLITICNITTTPNEQVGQTNRRFSRLLGKLAFLGILPK